MKAGFIGAGSMGSLLVSALLRAHAFRPSDVTVSTRTSSKAERLAREYAGLRVASANADAVRDADLVFLCIKPMDYRPVLDEIKPVLTAEQIVVSITSPVTIRQLEDIVPSKVAKIIPSVVNEVGGGASMFMYGTRLTSDDRAYLNGLFAAISRPIEIPEDEVRVASDLSSCGPAFMACLLEQFVEAAVELTGMERSLASRLAAEMLLGTARLLSEPGSTPAELQARVSVPGGITAAALEELRAATAGAFQRVLRTTHQKYAEDLEKVEASLAPKPFPS
ncbi:late competence protein ComER [Cohnella nanjingensis]|uniref:Pyrroline-5-carboxylate reductase n=1 Tax=Cohnella nanjingensis TaxID=1387779 RepID=A0A7X0VHJ1_9BACL|nr:late competence protein ComER [Cohnella nanjingensis]MBB6673946.1 late competence protein ComER [Cohnella nanjingensis]